MDPIIVGTEIGMILKDFFCLGKPLRSKLIMCRLIVDLG